MRVGTEVYDSWESVEIVKSIDSLCSAFSVGVSDKWRNLGENWTLTPGELVRLAIGSDAVFNGYIEKLDAEIADGSRSIAISGRDRTCDIVDSSVVGANEYKNVDLLDLGKKLCFEVFGIKVTSDTDIGGKFPVWKIKPGETVFETLMPKTS